MPPQQADGRQCARYAKQLSFGVPTNTSVAVSKPISSMTADFVTQQTKIKHGGAFGRSG